MSNQVVQEAVYNHVDDDLDGEWMPEEIPEDSLFDKNKFHKGFTRWFSFLRKPNLMKPFNFPFDI